MEAGPSGMAKLDGHNEEEIQRKIPMKIKFTQEESDELVARFETNSKDRIMAEYFCRKVRFDGLIPDQNNPHYTGLSQCWRWDWKCKGYPIALYGVRRGETAHRVSYKIFKGPIPKGMCVMHRCDNKVCTNPFHLELGTNAQNVKDAHIRGLVKKGRTHSKKSVQSMYVISVLHNAVACMERNAETSSDNAMFKSWQWGIIKGYLDDAFLQMTAIHLPKLVKTNSRGSRLIEELKHAKSESLYQLLSQAPEKVKILRPEEDVSSLSRLWHDDFARFRYGILPIIKEEDEDIQDFTPVKEMPDGSIYTEIA